MKRCILLILALLLAVPALAAENGIYAADIALSEDVLGLADALVTVTDGGITVRLTGTASDGEILAVDGREIVPAVSAGGEYVYILPLAGLDAPQPMRWQDLDGEWHDFTLTVGEEDLQPVGSAEEAQLAEGEIDPADLPDGDYLPESFEVRGGSGEADIVCDVIHVRSGAATVEIAFSNPDCVCVKVDGAQYESISTGDASIFEIPVKLGVEFHILGMIAAMSQPQEIEYVLRILPGERMGE